MSAYPYRLQATWLGLLALVWLGFCAPSAAGLKLLLSVAVVAVVLGVVALDTHRTRARRRTTAQALSAIDRRLHNVPPDLKGQMPLVIAVGDTQILDSAFHKELVSVTEDAIWVRCDAPPALMHLADALKRWRAGQGPDAVALLIAADQGSAPVTALCKAWGSALTAASRVVGYALPVCVALYGYNNDGGAEHVEDAPWFGVSGGQRLDPQALPTLVASRLEQDVLVGETERQEQRTRRAARLDALARWGTQSEALGPLWGLQSQGRASWNVTAFGVSAVRGTPASDSPFGQFVAALTGLVAAPAASRLHATYSLPDALLAGMPRQPVRRAWPRALGHAVIGLAAFFALGTAASAWQNRALMQRVAQHAAHYAAIPVSNDAARVDALGAVKRDRDEIERYANAGVPLRLGFGLYRGAAWLLGLNQLIAGYEPPAPPPSTIELDSMSLFASGSAVLNPGSNRVLVAALAMIQAHPDKRVLVAGHTDAVGQTQANLALSAARAGAVRDWLVDASGLSPTRFAIQGYGDTRPKAPNTTEAGRAANRRVEITLVPDCRHDDGSRSPPGHPACS